MRILLSIKNLGIGGVQTYLIQLANALSVRHKVWVYVHYPYTSEKSNLSRLKPAVIVKSPADQPGIDAFHWKINRIAKNLSLKRLEWEAYNQRHLLNTLKNNAIECIISFDLESDELVSLLKPSHQLPILLSLHGNYDIKPEAPWNEADINRFRKVFSAIEGIVYKTEDNIRLIKEMGPFPNIRVMQHILHGYSPDNEIKNKNEVRQALNIPLNAFVFSMVARGDPTKGWKEALEAFRLLLEEPRPALKDIRFICQGSGSYMQELKILCQSIPEVIFIPESSKTAETAVVSDVGVLPSYFRTENYSYTLIEYLHYGKPVIATKHGLIPETLRAEKKTAGILIPLTSTGKVDVLDIKNAMHTMLFDEVTYRELQILTSLAVKKFNSAQSVETYEQVINVILSSQ